MASPTPATVLPRHDVNNHVRLCEGLLRRPSMRDPTVHAAVAARARFGCQHGLLAWRVSQDVSRVFPGHVDSQCSLFPSPESMRIVENRSKIHKENVYFRGRFRPQNINFGVPGEHFGILGLFLATWSAPGCPKGEPRRKREVFWSSSPPLWVPFGDKFSVSFWFFCRFFV